MTRLALLVVVAISGLTVVLASSVKPPDLQKALYTGAATLFFGGVLGGWLKILLDDVVAARVRRGESAKFVGNVLADLKGVYDQIESARILIQAHRSAKTYGTEMGNLIQACVQLRNVIRALEGTAAMAEEMRARIVEHVRAMHRFVQELTDEFQERYKEVSDLQREYEARVDRVTKQNAEGGARLEYPPPVPWQKLSAFPTLTDLLAKGVQYRALETHLDEASHLLRAEIARILGHRLPARKAVTNTEASATRTPQPAT